MKEYSRDAQSVEQFLSEVKQIKTSCLEEKTFGEDYDRVLHHPEGEKKE